MESDVLKLNKTQGSLVNSKNEITGRHPCLSCIHCRIKWKFKPEYDFLKVKLHPTGKEIEVFCRKGLWFNLKGELKVFISKGVLNSGGKALYLTAPDKCDLYEGGDE